MDIAISVINILLKLIGAGAILAALLVWTDIDSSLPVSPRKLKDLIFFLLIAIIALAL